MPIQESRSADTCVDPSTAITFIQELSSTQDAFALSTEAGWAAGIIAAPTSGYFYEGKVFLGWDTQDPQGFTTPLYLLVNPTTTDYIAVLAVNGNPPAVAGFTDVIGVIGYVYSTQVCGSVPLLGAANAAAGSHYYTTQVNDHAQLITHAGWADAGIAAYVLPLSA